MRTFAYRHPSIVVLALVAAWIAVTIPIGEEIRHQRWGYLACTLAVSTYLINRIRAWWERT